MADKAATWLIETGHEREEKLVRVSTELTLVQMSSFIQMRFFYVVNRAGKVITTALFH
jgi:hypothetical protein